MEEYCQFFDVKEVGEDGTFTGIASQYGVEDLTGDIIDRGAATKTIKENPVVPLLWQHDAQEVIGEAHVEERQGRIMLTGKLDLDDPVAQKAYAKLKKKLIKGLSIGFTAIKTLWEEVDGRMIRHISEMKLWEISVVTFPALPSAQVMRVKAGKDSDVVQILRAWCDAEFQTPTSDTARAADLRTLFEKGLALLRTQTTPGDGAGRADGAAQKDGEPVTGHSAIYEFLEKRKELYGRERS